VKHKAKCPTCATSTRPGLLWLGGNDWVECPSECDRGTIEIHEQRFAPTERTISVGGITMQVPRHHPLARLEV